MKAGLGITRGLLLAAGLWAAGILSAQSADPTYLPPNYKRIAREVRKTSGPYCYDSLLALFSRCDTALTVDALRCLYYGGDGATVARSLQAYRDALTLSGRHEGRANEAWTQYQMVLSAVWSSGDASREHPLHVRSVDEARCLMGEECPGAAEEAVGGGCRYALYRFVCDDGTPEGCEWWFCVKKRPISAARPR